MLLVAYASLYPFSGWRDVGLSPLAFLNGPWPRYVTAFDITVNVAGYLPFGLLAVLAIYPRLAPTATEPPVIAAAFLVALEHGPGSLIGHLRPAKGYNRGR